MSRVRVAVVGATGYTGAELLRLLLLHPNVEVTRVVGGTKAGQPIEQVLPSFAGVLRGDVEAFDAERVAASADVAFCALPHGASAGIVEALRDRGVRVFDLSADFRLKDRAVYETWYGAHEAPRLFGSAAYGLVELNREALRTADLVAVPGCYPTASSLALAPLLHAGLVSAQGLVVDAKSGVSGAGRTPTASSHLPETAEGFRAYKIASHRHTPEIEQVLSDVAGAPIRLLFTPHLLPMSRGILATCYAELLDANTDAARCSDAARALFDGSPFVHVLAPGKSPDTLWVRASNRVHLSYTVDARTRRVIAIAAIDNLVKGAAGQAVQAFNVRHGFLETSGLATVAVWP